MILKAWSNQSMSNSATATLLFSHSRGEGRDVSVVARRSKCCTARFMALCGSHKTIAECMHGGVKLRRIKSPTPPSLSSLVIALLLVLFI